jgi:hypothetical protein
VSIIALAAVAEPMIRSPYGSRQVDDFPLSTYPMFAAKRPDATLYLDYAVGLTADQQRRFIPPRDVANSEVLQARAVLAKAMNGGADARRALCERIAARVVQDRRLTDVVTITLVSGKHDAMAYLTRGETGTEQVRATCPVPGRAASGGAP